MTVFKLTYRHLQDGRCIEWFSTRTECRQRGRSLMEDKQIEGPSVFEEASLPTSKIRMIEWLNANLNRDNG